ncbi:hypothetical protein GOODEAATRI_023408 [Goodea atripinnis]|uniref:Uncharacterized protein n=1 Tax=Goodea atripinnis TaxID=208336 RepID=A0ABV0NN07_9TELE
MTLFKEFQNSELSAFLANSSGVGPIFPVKHLETLPLNYRLNSTVRILQTIIQCIYYSVILIITLKKIYINILHEHDIPHTANKGLLSWTAPPHTGQTSMDTCSYLRTIL